MNLAQVFNLAVDANPSKTAVYWGDAEYSYKALNDQSLGVAERLIRDFKVKPDDRVGIWLRNCPEFIPALFGILHAGAVAVPINHFLKPAEVGFIVAVFNDNYSSTSATIKNHHWVRSVFHCFCGSYPGLFSTPLGGTEPLERSDKGAVEPRGVWGVRYVPLFFVLSLPVLRLSPLNSRMMA